MKLIGGTFNATGSDLSIGIGFVPDFVKVWNVNDAGTAYTMVEWNRNMRRIAACMEGITLTTQTDADRAPLVKGAGIDVYMGTGVALSAADSNILVASNLARQDHQRTVGSTLANLTWTLGSSANRTGNFSAALPTDYIASGIEGSEVIIRTSNGVIYNTAIVALTNNGSAANEVTLADAVPSGSVEFVGSPFDYIGAPAGVMVPPGFSIDSATTEGFCDVSGELHIFEAGCYSDAPLSFGNNVSV